MSISLSTALSGMSVAQERLRASASNVAASGTGDLRRLQVEAQTLEGGGVKAQLRQVPASGQVPEQDLINQHGATYTFVANLRVLQTQVRAEGALLDIQA